MTYPFGVTLTVRRSPGEDSNGDPLPAVEHQVAECALAPRTSSEDTNLRDTVISGYDVYGPYDADILATDQILVPGEAGVWQVTGDIGKWANPYTGDRPGSQFVITRVTG